MKYFQLLHFIAIKLPFQQGLFDKRAKQCKQQCLEALIPL